MRSEIREFLATRRAKITPEQAGLRRYGRNRRVPGQRREEVVLLAGISIEYYTRLERGNAAGQWHWHGAAPGHFMAHLSITEAVPGDQRPEADWGEHVTGSEYGTR